MAIDGHLCGSIAVCTETRLSTIKGRHTKMLQLIGWKKSST